MPGCDMHSRQQPIVKSVRRETDFVWISDISQKFGLSGLHLGFCTWDLLTFMLVQRNEKRNFDVACRSFQKGKFLRFLCKLRFLRSSFVGNIIRCIHPVL